MSTKAAEEFLARAASCLDHARGKAKIDESAINMCRRMIELAVGELQEKPAPELRLVLPRGCVEGRSNVRRGDWR